MRLVGVDEQEKCRRRLVDSVVSTGHSSILVSDLNKMFIRPLRVLLVCLYSY